MPTGRPLWALREDVRVVIDEDTIRVTIDLGGSAGLRQIRLDGADPLLRAVLYRMSLGPVSLENVAGLEESARDWRRGTGPCTAWRTVRAAFDQLGGCVVAALGAPGDAVVDLAVVAVDPDAVFRLPPSPPPAAPLRLRPDAGVESGPDVADRLVCPTARFRVELSSHRTCLVTGALAQGACTVDQLAQRSGQKVEFVTDVLAYATGAGMTASVT